MNSACSVISPGPLRSQLSAWLASCLCSLCLGLSQTQHPSFDHAIEKMHLSYHSVNMSLLIYFYFYCIYLDRWLAILMKPALLIYLFDEQINTSGSGGERSRWTQDIILRWNGQGLLVNWAWCMHVLGNRGKIQDSKTPRFLTGGTICYVWNNGIRVVTETYPLGYIKFEIRVLS